MSTMSQMIFDDGRTLIETGLPLNASSVSIVERKGYGHPDKLADDLAETLSRTYSQWTERECGAILHHNFDKLALLGGAASVQFGEGRLTRPIRVLVNGRVSRSFAGRSIPVEELLGKATLGFFSGRLHGINEKTDIQIEWNLSSESSPGKVDSNISKNDGARHRWFHPMSLDDLRERRELLANDTSMGSGFAPLTPTEKAVHSLTDFLSDPSRPDRPLSRGTDVKVMGAGWDRSIRLVACVPQIAQHVSSLDEYVHNLNAARVESLEFLTRTLPDFSFELVLNARDRLRENEIYLTATGSSIESGDEGVVGRGNRVNGLITPLRPMNIEGANGKNPVYHVGKLYNVLCQKIAQRLHNNFGGPVQINIVSRTGGKIDEPWFVSVQMGASTKAFDEIRRILAEEIERIPDLTKEIVRSSGWLS